MDIIHIEFEKNLVIERGNTKITITPFETLTFGTVSLGVEAPRISGPKTAKSKSSKISTDELRR